MHGEWSQAELLHLHISVLETLTTAMSTPAYLEFEAARPKGTGLERVTHVLEFTDNSGCEWSMRRETPHAELLQEIVAARQEELLRRQVYVRSERVPSRGNRWADWLSRGHVRRVLGEAAALGLRAVRLQPDAYWRDTGWLVARARRLDAGRSKRTRVE